MAREHWSVVDIPSLAGRVAVVTGANTGLGLETARALATHGAAVVLAVRDVARGERAMDDIRASRGLDVTVQALDLASLRSIRDAAHAVRERHARIDLVVNNAGVMCPPRGTTEDGFELQLGVNHLGHFAFNGLLLDRLLPVEGSRVVTVSSVGHRVPVPLALDGRDPTRRHPTRQHHWVLAYARSKVANLLFTQELQRRLVAAGAATVALAAHPGWSSTELLRSSPLALRFAGRVARPLGQTPAQGARSILRAATDPEARGGDYYGPGGYTQLWGPPRLVRSSRQSHDRALASQLWEASESMTGVAFPV